MSFCFIFQIKDGATGSVSATDGVFPKFQVFGQWKLNFFLMKMNSVIVYGLIFLSIIDPGRHFAISEQIYNPEKFISKKYFEKYDTLIDSKFNSFIENEIPYYLSEVLQENNYATPTTSDLHQNIVGEGSHRRLCSYLRFNMRPEFESYLSRQSCVVVLIERLPSGVFADPFELQHLVHRGVFTGAAVFGDTNLELPSFQSNRSVVEIHMDVASKVFSRNQDELGVDIEVPLHARYQPLGLGFSRVEFGRPDVFMCCSVERNANWSCSIMPKNCGFSCYSSRLVWDIPCGVREHAAFVSIITFLSAVVAVLFIVSASVCYSDNSISYKLKHL
ncbi:phosphatidylinositol-glycan biosynthesis class X protein-like [Dorcoceras hygrometricum]|uniref:Phosphatidylinositol-glycan biosynthesis class X protein-like n=1 Tax=Dorcoceras hygrometricum TaxID=472368 RepID=A0A2Z7CKR1_9LAMI|nr:phosphatidylinositol-glycan biosynthesis class X protein-like [Dorcoceras hygrometricum]